MGHQFLPLDTLSFLFFSSFFTYQLDFSLFWLLNLFSCSNLFLSLLFFVIFQILCVLVTVNKLKSMVYHVAVCNTDEKEKDKKKNRNGNLKAFCVIRKRIKKTIAKLFECAHAKKTKQKKNKKKQQKKDYCKVFYITCNVFYSLLK